MDAESFKKEFLPYHRKLYCIAYRLSATLESKGLPGLYACGELLDIDGDCGGYNLQWAWSSGFVAGKSAAVSLLSHSQPPAEANS